MKVQGRSTSPIWRRVAGNVDGHEVEKLVVEGEALIGEAVATADFVSALPF